MDDKISSSTHKILSKSIDNTICQSINNYLNKNEVSKTAFFISIYGYVLSKFIHQDIIYTSIIGSNRSNYYKENMFGMFVNNNNNNIHYNNFYYNDLINIIE